MAYTITDRDALKEAIASGVLTVEYNNGNRITYRSLNEMKRILADINAEIAEAAGTPVKRQVKIFANKGL